MELQLNGKNDLVLAVIMLFMLVITTSCSSPVSTIMYSSEVLSPKQVELELGSDVITTSTSAKVSALSSPLAFIPHNAITSERLKTPAGFISPSVGFRIGMPFNTEGAIRYHFWRGLNAYYRKNIFSTKTNSIGLSVGLHFNYFNWNMFFYEKGSSPKFQIREFTLPINLTLPLDKQNQLYLAYIPGKRYYQNYIFITNSEYFFAEAVYRTVSFFNHSVALGLVDERFLLEFNVTVYPYRCFQTGIVFPILRSNKKYKNEIGYHK